MNKQYKDVDKDFADPSRERNKFRGFAGTRNVL
jgi:hypothetical protein